MTRLFKTSCGCEGVDVHCHVVPADFPNQPDSITAGWPSMRHDDCGHRTIMIDAKPYRQVSAACWEARRRIEDMDEMGIALQVLSPMPELFGYWLPAAAASLLARHVNDCIAAMITEGHGRFVGLGSVALQDLDLAVAELQRIMALPGFRGVEIGSNVNEKPIGHPDFDPFFAEAQRLGAAIFVHAVRPAGMARLVGPAPLQQVLGYPTDIGLALASAVTGGLAQKFPALRMAFSHGGGSFCALLPRLRQGYEVFPALKASLGASPDEIARHFYVDSLVFDKNFLSHLLGVFGPEKIMIGTDYPFNFREKSPCTFIASATDHQSLQARLLQSNALAFLALQEVSFAV